MTTLEIITLTLSELERIEKQKVEKCRQLKELGLSENTIAELCSVFSLSKDEKYVYKNQESFRGLMEEDLKKKLQKGVKEKMMEILIKNTDGITVEMAKREFLSRWNMQMSDEQINSSLSYLRFVLKKVEKTSEGKYRLK